MRCRSGHFSCTPAPSGSREGTLRRRRSRRGQAGSSGTVPGQAWTPLIVRNTFPTASSTKWVRYSSNPSSEKTRTGQGEAPVEPPLPC